MEEDEVNEMLEILEKASNGLAESVGSFDAVLRYSQAVGGLLKLEKDCPAGEGRGEWWYADVIGGQGGHLLDDHGEGPTPLAALASLAGIIVENRRLA